MTRMRNVSDLFGNGEEGGHGGLAGFERWRGSLIFPRDKLELSLECWFNSSLIVKVGIQSLLGKPPVQAGPSLPLLLCCHSPSHPRLSSASPTTGDSTLAAPGKVEQFIALNQKLRESDASKSSTYNADVKKFQTLGKQLKAEGLQYKKVLGSSEFAQAAVKLMEDLSDDVATLGDMLKELVGDILKRDTSEIAAPGKVEQFIALNQKLTQPDASKSSTYGADVKQFQSLGKQLKKEGLSTDKALGSSAFAVAAKKMIKDVSDDVKEVGSMLTEALGDVVKRDGLADLIGDIIPTEENLKKLSNALTNPEAVSSPHYQKTLENLKKVGLKMKKDGKDVKSLVGTGEQAEALAEMFNQAGDKQTDVRDNSIPILSGRSEYICLVLVMKVMVEW